MDSVIILLDGEFMRKRIISTKSYFFEGKNILNHCLKHIKKGDVLKKIYYYDAHPYIGKGEHPISGPIDFSKTPLVTKKSVFLTNLKNTPMIQLRLGYSTWQAGAWSLDPQVLEEVLAGEKDVKDIKEENVLPDIRQKGIDTQIGIDAASIVYEKLATKVVIIGNDSDIVPACKFMREHGITVVLDPIWSKAPESLRENVDSIVNAINKPVNMKNVYVDTKNLFAKFNDFAEQGLPVDDEEEFDLDSIKD